MTIRISRLINILFCSLSCAAKNGDIISQQEFQVEDHHVLFADLTNEGESLKPKYNYLDEVAMKTFLYKSDGLKVKGYAYKILILTP